MNKVDHFFDFLIIEVDQYRWMSGQFLFSSSNAILVILCDTTIEVYEDHLSKIQFRLAKVLLEMLENSSQSYASKTIRIQIIPHLYLSHFMPP